MSLTTKEAFAQLIRKRGWHKDLPISTGAAHTLAKRFKDGEMITIDKMEEVLEMAGAKVIQEKLWDLPAEPGGERGVIHGATYAEILQKAGIPNGHVPDYNPYARGNAK
jgi:hypothetical protein